MPPATLTTNKRAGTYDETQFDMPRTSQSKSVLWFPDQNTQDSYTALVLKVDDRSIDIAVLTPESVTFHIKTGVRHRNDPDAELIARSRAGVWDFSEDDNSKLLLDMAKAIKGLGDRVERLEKK